MTAPCLDCPDREMGCHSKCEKYQKYREYRHKIYEARLKNTAVGDLIVNGVYQRRKKGRKDHKV